MYVHYKTYSKKFFYSLYSVENEDLLMEILENNLYSINLHFNVIGIILTMGMLFKAIVK